MLVSLYILIISGLILAALFFLFKAEAASGRRLLLARSREQADRTIEARFGGYPSGHGLLGAASIRLFLHFLLHLLLGAALKVTKGAESLLHRLRSHNHRVAHQMSVVSEDSHLTHIVRHKEAVSLSDQEKADLKERSLND